MPKQSVLWLEVPFTTLLDRQPEDAQTEFEGKNVGFAANQWGTLGNRKFLSENPAARRFLELVSIPQADIKAEMSYLKAGADSAAELRTRTKAWIDAHDREFQSWLQEARQAAKQSNCGARVGEVFGRVRCSHPPPSIRIWCCWGPGTATRSR